MIIYTYSFIATTFQSTQLLRVFKTFEFEKETSILYPFCEVFSNKYQYDQYDKQENEYHGSL